ncbi:hypothetical protein F5B19DRAFT_499333 [Rostrohypoxylon terebratum]|nr:hypothetical protein F5B19DRAFT_499333 [Rostrohypoxylon terebratum]
MASHRVMDKTSWGLIRELRKSIAKGCDDLVFACGGSVPIRYSQATKGHEVPYCNPVALRWDSSNPSALNSHCKLVVPLEPSTSNNFTNLIADMTAAANNNDEENKSDEEYKKALQFDASQFSTNFSPYACEIIDAVAQFLLPEFIEDDDECTAVKAELCNLIVCASPSGAIQGYVDTPRSDSFGSLVVCLPITYEGGQLEVQRNGKTTTFDWAGQASSQPVVKWAAFYKDCKLKMHEVRSGYCVLLTYNLYDVRGNGHLTDHCNVLDITQTPLYRHLRPVFDQSLFLPNGGYLGFYTRHHYPHTSIGTSFRVPENLKGIDMALWECFQALGCHVRLRPVAEFEHGIFDLREEDESEPVKFIGGSFKAFVGPDKYGTMGVVYLFDQWWRPLFGRNLRHSNVNWLNRPGHEEFQMAFTYRNSTEAVYSSCAIIVKVPSYEKRVAPESSDTSTLSIDPEFDDEWI